jgi:hypothetical protein
MELAIHHVLAGLPGISLVARVEYLEIVPVTDHCKRCEKPGEPEFAIISEHVPPWPVCAKCAEYAWILGLTVQILKEGEKLNGKAN